MPLSWTLKQPQKRGWRLARDCILLGRRTCCTVIESPPELIVSFCPRNSTQDGFAEVENLPKILLHIRQVYSKVTSSMT